MARNCFGRAAALSALIGALVAVVDGTALAARSSSRSAPTGGEPAPGRVLIERLRSAGRAEASFQRAVFDPLSGKIETVRGELVLEPPDRVSLRFPSTGERVTLRSDGGEWLQPRLKQMLRLGPERATAARRWWEMLLPDREGVVVARPLGAARYLLVARAIEAAPAESAWVSLDARGLPASLEIDEGATTRTVYRFSPWRFPKPRGRGAFVIEAPAGFEVVSLP
jgi:hypothetical protein